jgi:hypothetical protein
VLGLPGRAAAQYKTTQVKFEKAALWAEAQEAAQNAAACIDVSAGNVEQRLSRVHAAVASASPATVTRASHLIQLGEIQLETGNLWAAIATFKDAEATMEQAGYGEPPAPGTILNEMIASMVGDGGNGPELVRRAGKILKLRLLFYRLYSGLKNAHAPVDAANPGNRGVADYYTGLIKKHELLSLRK